MRYQLQQVGNNVNDLLDVNEQQWGNARTINFGLISSCITILGSFAQGGQTYVRGVHLVIVGRDGQDDVPVNDPDSDVIGQVKNIMDGTQNRACVGYIDIWKQNLPNNFFNNLMGQLNIPNNRQVQLDSDGVLQVRWNNNRIEYQHKNGPWTPIP